MPERRVSYQKLNRNAEDAFSVEAPSLQRLYIDAALALTDMRVALDLVDDLTKLQLTAAGATREKLLLAWLNGILGLFAKENFSPKRIVFDKFDGKEIKATLHGQKYDPLRHGSVSTELTVSSSQLEIGEKAVPEPHYFAKVFLENNQPAVAAKG